MSKISFRKYLTKIFNIFKKESKKPHNYQFSTSQLCLFVNLGVEYYDIREMCDIFNCSIFEFLNEFENNNDIIEAINDLSDENRKRLDFLYKKYLITKV